MKRLIGTAAFLTFALSTAARADVTAEQVWDGIAAYYTDLGHKLEIESRNRQDDTLVLGGVTLTNGDGTASATVTIDQIRLRELGDGRVEIVLPQEIPLRVSGMVDGKPGPDMAMRMTQSGLSLIASGTPQDLTYDFSAPSLGFAITDMKVEGESTPMSFNVTLSDNEGFWRVTDSGARRVVSEMKAAKADFDASATDPEGEGKFSASGSIVGLTSQTDMTLPAGVGMDDMAAALQAGMSLSGEFGYQGGGYVMDFADKVDSMHSESTYGEGALRFAMSKRNVTYGVLGKEIRISAQVASLPMPIEMALNALAFDLELPLSRSETAQPFGALLRLSDLTVSDGLWSMFDPAGQLPRDPATLVLDIAGKARVLTDLLDPQNATQITEGTPAELDSVELRELRLTAVGADLRGDGQLTFDNTGPMPRPVGAINLSLSGANALMDKLVAMGLIPQDQAMGFRMMLGLFAQPAGDDMLRSQIEFREDGGIYANGQRIQ